MSLYTTPWLDNTCPALDGTELAPAVDHTYGWRAWSEDQPDIIDWPDDQDDMPHQPWHVALAVAAGVLLMSASTALGIASQSDAPTTARRAYPPMATIIEPTPAAPKVTPRPSAPRVTPQSPATTQPPTQPPTIEPTIEPTIQPQSAPAPALCCSPSACFPPAKAPRPCTAITPLARPLTVNPNWPPGWQIAARAWRPVPPPYRICYATNGVPIPLNMYAVGWGTTGSITDCNVEN